MEGQILYTHSGAKSFLILSLYALQLRVFIVEENSCKLISWSLGWNVMWILVMSGRINPTTLTVVRYIQLNIRLRVSLSNFIEFHVRTIQFCNFKRFMFQKVCLFVFKVCKPNYKNKQEAIHFFFLY